MSSPQSAEPSVGDLSSNNSSSINSFNPVNYSLTPIGYIESCYQEKFGIPRQANLAKAAQAKLYLLPTFSRQVVQGLEQFSHIWLIFLFHATQAAGWHASVRPPRLGGNQRLGVFATRSTFRPNPLGLSAVKLDEIQFQGEQAVLYLSGVDLLNNTPVLDIKPYLPYADRIDQAQAGFAQRPPTEVPVCFTNQALQDCQLKGQQWHQDLQTLIVQILQQDPRPAYRVGQLDEHRYAMRLYDFDVRWHYTAQGIEVLELR